MALQYSPKIVQDSLVMCLDASNNKSYPTDLPVKNGLVMWMDAADDTTFSYSSGTTVSQWRDKSGLNNHMVPISAAPTRNAFLNSRKVLAFTTTQQIRNTTLSLINSANTVFVRRGSNSIPTEEKIPFSKINTETVISIENNSRNSIKNTLDSVLEFVNVKHKDLHSEYNVFKELFVVCWSGVKKKVRDQIFYSRVDIELINEQVKLFLSDRSLLIIISHEFFLFICLI